MMLMMQATGGQHHQHHWEPVSQIWRLPVPPPTSKKQCWGPEGPRRLVFKTVRAHDAHFGGFNGPLKCLKNPSVPLGFAYKTHVNFGVVLEGGPGGPLEKRRSNDAGSAALASAPWQSQGHGLRRQPKSVARFKGRRRNKRGAATSDGTGGASGKECFLPVPEDFLKAGMFLGKI